MTFVGRDFGPLSMTEEWQQVSDFLANELGQGPEIGYTVELSVRDFKDIDQGGIYSIGPAYINVDDYLLSSHAT